ncbi:MAG: FIVAR domain-containing protein [Clostridia bacterium]|nr:FIVAR domain-containing protein [Clostridia bacterium]
MKKMKKVLSVLLVVVMTFSIFTSVISAETITPTGTVFKEIPTTPGERPTAEFFCTEVTRVAKGANSVEPGNVIVKATPSGVPELSGAYAAQAYAGETPSATKITFISATVGVTPVGLSCNNETVTFTDMQYDGSTGTYSCEITGGTAQPGDALVFTMDYKWTDGNEYQEKCVSYVEGIATGGVFTYIECTFKPFSGTASYYRTSVSAITRLLGKSVFYEQPASITTSGSDPYKTYGVYNVATSNYLSNVASGYNTLIYTDDKNVEANGGTKDIYFTNYIPGVPTAHVYVDSSKATTLADINLRMDASTRDLSTRNNGNPYTAVSNMYVHEGLQVNGIPGGSNTTAEQTIGYVIPAKADYGVKQQYKNTAMNTITGGARAYSKIFTKGFTGTVANIADGSQYTITNEYYSYNYVDHSLDRGNLTTIAQVATPIVFHVVDKGALWTLLDKVMHNDPESPLVKNQYKGTNPQAWYYKSGFAAFQTSYVDALRVANNIKATQSEVDAAVKSLQTLYNSLTLKVADYSKVNELKTIAEAIIDNAYAYSPEDVALVEEALSLVKKNYNILYQNAVDVMADNLRLAIQNADPAPADYQAVYAAKIAFEELDKDYYTAQSWQKVLDVIAGIDFGLSVLEQDIVDGYAQDILDATAALVIRTADFTKLIETADEADSLQSKYYTNFEIIYEPLSNAHATIADAEINLWLPARQSEVDEMHRLLRNAIDSLILKDLDKSALKEAIDAELYVLEKYYDQTLLSTYRELVADGQSMYDDATLNAFAQDSIDAKTAEIIEAYEALQASYNPPVDLTELEKAIAAANEIIIEHYYEDDSLVEFLAAKLDAENLYVSDLTTESQPAVDKAVARIYNAIAALNIKPADTTALAELRVTLASMLSEKLRITTYIDGELGEKKVIKYNEADVLTLLKEVNELLDEENLTIKDNERINAFVENINERISALEIPETDEYLQVAINEYATFDSYYYTEEEWSLYENAYNNAISLTENATQDEINTALTNLVNAIPQNRLVFVDKTELEKVVSTAEEVKTWKYVNNEALQEFIDAVEEGNTILDTKLVDTEENRAIVNSSVTRIEEAQSNLSLVDDPSIIYPVVGRIQLLINKKIEVVTYIDGELDIAKLPLYDTEVLQAMLDEITAALEAEITPDQVGWLAGYAEEVEARLDTLEELTYSEYLDVAIAEYESFDEKYLTENYTNAYTVAKAINESSKQSDIDTALTNLVIAKNQIVIPLADKTELEKVIAVADGLNLSDYYNDETMAEFLNAVAEGKDILNTPLYDTDINNEIILNSVIRIEEAIIGLHEIDDVTVLYEVLQIASAKQKETIEVVTYIDGNLGTKNMPRYDNVALTAIVDEIAELLAPDAILPDEYGWVDKVMQAKIAELDALEELTYPEYLNVAIGEFDAVEDSSIYTEETWSDYEDAYEVAVNLTETEQTQINTALTNLVNAKKALEFAEVKTPYYFTAQEGTDTVIDRERGFIYGLDMAITDIEDYVDYAEGVTISAPDGYGTGTVITTIFNGEVQETFTVIIFGDLTGDGVVDIYDASTLAALVNGDIETEEGSPMAFAADLNNDTVADIYDLSILNAVVNGETELR